MSGPILTIGELTDLWSIKTLDFLHKIVFTMRVLSLLFVGMTVSFLCTSLLQRFFLTMNRIKPFKISFVWASAALMMFVTHFN
ncbi:hypothetical protein SynBIOSE41_03742 [Synechococcus sp. BIOS-E4-1]|nr:hypothetical protein SynBIOSE41_03742 [Synechococcus sp. BIOS-E4-1]